MSASHFSITKDSGGKKKFKTRKILFLFALITIIVCAIIVPIAVVYSQQPIDDDVDNGERVSCFPLIESEVNQTYCTDHGCKWDNLGVPVKCYIDRQSYGYKVVGTQKDPNGFSVELSRRNSPSLYGASYEKVLFQVTYYSDDMLRFSLHEYNSKIEDLQPPVPLNIPVPEVKDPKYEVVFDQTAGSSFEFKITRKASNIALLDTKLGGLTISEQFLMITFGLPSSFLYGIGENTHKSFVHDMNHKMWPIFARDQPPGDGEMNLYGSHPFYMISEDDGSSHGVFLFNSHAIDVTTLPAPGLTYRTIGGALDFFVFLGPQPEDVVKQYTKLIGRPAIPPYYGLGFQICKYGYKNTQEIEEVVQRTRDAEIPQDIQYADIDYMDERADFTFGSEFKDLPDYISEANDEGLRFILIIDHVINTEREGYETHELAMKDDVYIKWFNDTIQPEKDCEISPKSCQFLDDVMLGYCWPNGRTAIPNFFKNETKEWWSSEFRKFYDTAKFSGIWIDMNEPSNFDTNLEKPFNWPIDKPSWNLICPTNKWDDPPYRTLSAKRSGSGRLSDKTLCMVGRMGPNNQHLHYELHNLFGWSETVATHSAVESATGKRALVISRSTFASSGKYAGHWLGDNTARWEDLHSSVIGLMEFNMFGIPYVGADICGFFANTTDELCARWMELGAFYPFSRNHNSEDLIDQDPASLSELVINASRTALNIRYRLLPYLYTLLYESHTTGSTVVRPLYHEFRTDIEAKKVDKQFLWGPALLISPVLAENQVKLTAYVPNATWYDFYTEKMVPEESIGYTTLDAPLDKINLHIRGGYVLPTQKEELNTRLSRKNPFSLLVALDEKGEAMGSMFWDDGESINTVEEGKYNLLGFNYSKNMLVVTNENQGTEELDSLQLDAVKILGLNQKPKSIEANSTPLSADQYQYDSITKVLSLSKLNLPLIQNSTIALMME